MDIATYKKDVWGREVLLGVSWDWLWVVLVAAFVFIAIHTLRSGRQAEGNYWGEGATTLEWTLSSPPPFHQFEVLPRIK